MKDRDQILKDNVHDKCWPDEGFNNLENCPLRYIHAAMDEYAEEYAKAAIQHTLDEIQKAGFNTSVLGHATEFFLQSFKESLKK